MSLIGEALKKAHLEAIRQDNRSNTSIIHTPGVAQYRQPSTRRSWTTALVFTNILLALVIAAAVLWPTRSEPSQKEAAVATDEAVAAGVVPAAARNPEGEREQEASTSVGSRTPEAEPLPSGRSVPVKPVTTAAVEPPADPPVQSTDASAPSRAPLATVDGLVAGQTYMRSIPVPGGSDLILSGISVVGDRGVAIINTRMVREGDSVGPFTIGAIAKRKVTLSYRGITVYLTMP